MTNDFEDDLGRPWRRRGIFPEITNYTVDPDEKGWLCDIMVEPGIHKGIRESDITEKQIAEHNRLLRKKRTMSRYEWRQLVKTSSASRNSDTEEATEPYGGGRK